MTKKERKELDQISKNIKKKTQFLFRVQQEVIGTGRKENYYFRTKKEAEEFMKTREYTSLIRQWFMNDYEKERLLEATRDQLEFENNDFWM